LVAFQGCTRESFSIDSRSPSGLRHPHESEWRSRTGKSPGPGVFWCNTRRSERLGRTAVQSIRMTVPGAIAAWQRSVETGESFGFEGRHRRADGVYRWFQMRGLSLAGFRRAHRPSGTLLQTDVENHKRTEEALRASEQNLRQIIDSIPGLVCTMSPAGAIEHQNQQVLDYFGRTAEELRDWAFTDAVHPDDLQRVIEVLTKSITTGTLYDIEHRCRRADGVYRWFQVRALPVRDTDNRVTGWYVLLIDIDDRKRAEEALRGERTQPYPDHQYDSNARLVGSTPTAPPNSSTNIMLTTWGFLRNRRRSGGWTTAVHPRRPEQLGRCVATY
jgi:PAS domain S-box-containing protein